MFSKSSRMCLIKISQPSIFSFAMPFSFPLSSFHCMALKNDKIHISVQPPHSPKLKMAGVLYPNLRAVTLILWSLASALSSFRVTVTTSAGAQILSLDVGWRAEGQCGQRAEAAGNEDQWVEGETKFQISPLGNRAIVPIECSGQVVHTRHRWL